MVYRVMVLNGVSSSGKSSIARALQARLPEPWLTFSVDDLVEALPATLQADDDGGAGIHFGADGAVSVGELFARLNAAWEQGIAAMARSGAPVIVDDVFIRGEAGQARWRAALGDVATLWVGVHCEAAELARRERARGDRTVGMAAHQLPLVHRGVHYDIEVDTTHDHPGVCADRVVAHLAQVSAGQDRPGSVTR